MRGRLSISPGGGYGLHLPLGPVLKRLMSPIGKASIILNLFMGREVVHVGAFIAPAGLRRGSGGCRRSRPGAGTFNMFHPPTHDMTLRVRTDEFIRKVFHQLDTPQAGIS